MSVPSSKADSADTLRLHRLVQAVYVLQTLTLALALLGDGVVVTSLIVLLPATAGYVINRLRRDAARGTPAALHFAWQARSFTVSLLSIIVATLVLGPLLFVGLALLWFAYALIGLWLAWRVGRGVWALWKTLPLPDEAL